MALSNRERVGRVLDALTAGLAPFIIREYKQYYRSDYKQEIDRALTTYSYALPDEALQRRSVSHRPFGCSKRPEFDDAPLE